MSIQVFPYYSKFSKNIEVPNALDLKQAVNLGQLTGLLAGKLDSSDLDGFVYDVNYNSSTHVLTFFRQNQSNVVIDLPIEQLIKGVQLIGSDLQFTFEDGSVVLVPLNSLLVGVVKSVDGQFPNSSGELTTIATKYFGALPEYYKEHNIAGGGSVDVRQAFYNLVHTNGVASSVDIQDHMVHGARLVLRGTGSSAVAVYILNGIQDDGTPLLSVNLENGDKEFTWNEQLLKWRLTH